MQLFTIAYRNVLRNWRHSLAAIITVAVGLVSQVMFEGYMDNVREIYELNYRNRGMFGDVLIENEDTFSNDGKANSEKYLVTKAEQNVVYDFLRGYEPKLQAHVGFLQVTGMITEGKSSQIFWGFGYEPQPAAIVRDRWKWNSVYGLPLQKSTQPNSLLLAQTLAHNLSCDPLEKVTLENSFQGYQAVERPFKCNYPSMQLSAMTVSGQVNAVDLDVLGIIDSGYKELNARYVEMPLDQAQLLINTDGLSYISVLFKNKKDVPSFISDFDEKVRKNHSHLRAIRWQNHPVGDLYTRTMSILTIFRNFVLVVIFSISCLSVLNTMVKIIKERTREVGTLRSLGYLRAQVTTIFLYEAGLLSLLGCIIGAFLALGLTGLLNLVGIQYKAGMTAESLVFHINSVPTTYFLSCLILITLSTVTAYFACLGSLRKQITENLSYA